MKKWLLAMFVCAATVVSAQFGPSDREVKVVELKYVGYDRFATQGGDWGAMLSMHLAHKYPDRVTGMHVHLAVPLDLGQQHFRLAREPRLEPSGLLEFRAESDEPHRLFLPGPDRRAQRARGIARIAGVLEVDGFRTKAVRLGSVGHGRTMGWAEGPCIDPC